MPYQRISDRYGSCKTGWTPVWAKIDNGWGPVIMEQNITRDIAMNYLAGKIDIDAQVV